MGRLLSLERRKWMVCCLGCFICLSLNALPYSPLGEGAEISLFTCSAGQEVWAHYGHTAIRVNDPANHRDITFNYGVFDFNSEHFLWKFVSGQTDYILGACLTASFLNGYRDEQRGITEQVLNLHSEEKEALWKALCTNSRPENRSYRYNFFYDNCATRARIIIENNLQGALVYDSTAFYGSMREVVKHYTQDHPWAWWGISLAVSAEADRPASFIDQLFAPELMMLAFDQATIRRENGSLPLVQSTRKRLEATPPPSPSHWPSPLVCLSILFFGLLCVEVKEYQQKRCYWGIDSALFALAGLLGTVMAFLMFVSVHPDVHENWQLIAFHPLLIGFAIALCFPRFRTSQWAKLCWSINGLACLFLLVGKCFLPQYIHPATWLICLMMLSRTALFYLTNKRFL